MPKSSRVFLAVVLVLGLVLVVGLGFAYYWFSSPKLQKMTERLPRTIAGKVQLDIENRSNAFQMYVESQERGELALDLLSNELAVNGIKNVRLILTDEPQPNQVKYEGRDYFFSTSYSVNNNTLIILLNVNPEEYQAMKTGFRWNDVILSEQLELYVYKTIYQSARATQRETGNDGTTKAAQDFVQTLNTQNSDRLFSVF